MKLFFLLSVLVVQDFYIVHCSVVLRRKRDGSIFDQLGAAISKLTGPLLGTKETVQNNDPIASGQSSLSSLNSNNGPVNQAGPRSPSIVQSVGFCDDNQVQCDYLECLAHNFKNSDQASNLRQGTKVMADPDLRDAIATDPQVSKIACDKANLDASGCNGFKQLLGLFSKVDPKSAHIHDEPRDKRSSDYYDKLPDHGAKASASVSSSSSGSNTKGSSSNSNKGGSSSSSNSNKGGSSNSNKGGSSFTDYDHGSKSQSGSKGSSTVDNNAQKNCEAILHKPSKAKSVSRSQRKPGR